MAVQENRYDPLDDEALLRHLSEEADRRKEGLAIEQCAGQWIAESYLRDGLSSGRSVMLGGRSARPAHGDAGTGTEVRRLQVVDAAQPGRGLSGAGLRFSSG